jgi:hypothetical protein
MSFYRLRRIDADLCQRNLIKINVGIEEKDIVNGKNAADVPLRS